jgi:hypothetical protein
MLRSVTLDAAYPVTGKDPFYPKTILTAKRAFDISCLRSVACHRAAPGSAWARLSVLAAYLRRHPVIGRTRDPFGHQRMNAFCAERTPEVRVVGTFPATLSRVTPATAGPGDQAGRTGLRLAAAGAAAVGDAVWRWYYGDGVKGWACAAAPSGSPGTAAVSGSASPGCAGRQTPRSAGPSGGTRSAARSGRG